MWLLLVVGCCMVFILYLCDGKVKLCALFCGKHKKELHRFVVLLLGSCSDPKPTHTTFWNLLDIAKQKYEKCLLFLIF